MKGMSPDFFRQGSIAGWKWARQWTVFTLPFLNAICFFPSSSVLRAHSRRGWPADSTNGAIPGSASGNTGQREAAGRPPPRVWGTRLDLLRPALKSAVRDTSLYVMRRRWFLYRELTLESAGSLVHQAADLARLLADCERAPSGSARRQPRSRAAQ
jgi:hypothetical protein